MSSVESPIPSRNKDQGARIRSGPHLRADRLQAANGLGWLGSFALSAATGLVVTVDAYSESFNSARVAVALAGILLLHAVRFARIVVVRETFIYACFLGYMIVQLTWTADRHLAMNTLVPAANFLLVLVLFGSLVEMHDLKAVLAGALVGFLLGAFAYMRVSGFPFHFPAEFSYNAVAGMLLFGLIVTLLLAAAGLRTRWLLVLAALIGIQIVATTSIKTSLGVLLGLVAAGIVHFGRVSQMLWRNGLLILAIAAVLAFAIAANEGAVSSIRRGAERVTLGIRILQAREDLPGYSAFEKRAKWQKEGFLGWIENPVFGHGVEAFRSRFGYTSHASHVDISYNSGLIGIALFYGMFAAAFLRLYRAPHLGARDARFVILGGLVCYFFMSFAGTIHYTATLAAFLALGIGILRRA